jgi:hypothetical protein
MKNGAQRQKKWHRRRRHGVKNQQMTLLPRMACRTARADSCTLARAPAPRRAASAKMAAAKAKNGGISVAAEKWQA